MIIFAGKTDTFTPFDEAKSIVKGYETKRRLVEYSGGHLEGWKLGETYFSTLKTLYSNIVPDNNKQHQINITPK